MVSQRLAPGYSNYVQFWHCGGTDIFLRPLFAHCLSPRLENIPTRFELQRMGWLTWIASLTLGALIETWFTKRMNCMAWCVHIMCSLDSLHCRLPIHVTTWKTDPLGGDVSLVGRLMYVIRPSHEPKHQCIHHLASQIVRLNSVPSCTLLQE